MARNQDLTPSVAETHFYWREYHGRIPIDAIEGGRDANGISTYIGRAVANLVNDSYGMYPGSVVKGQLYIEITVDHKIQISDLSVLILCSDKPNKFHWAKTSTWKFHDQIADASRYPVLGGIEKDASKQTSLYIGRYQSGFELVVGKIPFSDGEKENPLYYAHAQEEVKTDYFEVLIVEP